MKKVAPYVGESASGGNGAVGELASFLARMEGAAEVSADHVASAARITTGTTLEEGHDAASGDDADTEATWEQSAAPAQRFQKQASGSRAAITLLLAVAGCLVASSISEDRATSVIPAREKVASVIAPPTPRGSAQEPSPDSTLSATPRPARDGVPASARDGPKPPAPVAKSDPTQAVEPPVIADQRVASLPVVPQSPALPPSQPSPPPPVQAYVAPAPVPLPFPAERSAPGPLSPNVVVFMRRADRLIELGDISGARLLYERAASLGSGAAAFSMGRTFDPAFLSASHASIPPDEAKSAEWYRRAVTLGSVEAAISLRLLDHHATR